MDDLISRQAAIDAIGELCSCTLEEETRWREIIGRIPSAQQEQRWIPVTERLPKVGQTVICQCRADILKLLKLDRNGDWYQDAEHVYMKGFVIAWMPLPPIFREE